MNGTELIAAYRDPENKQIKFGTLLYVLDVVGTVEVYTGSLTDAEECDCCFQNPVTLDNVKNYCLEGGKIVTEDIGHMSFPNFTAPDSETDYEYFTDLSGVRAKIGEYVSSEEVELFMNALSGEGS